MESCSREKHPLSIHHALIYKLAKWTVLLLEACNLNLKMAHSLLHPGKFSALFDIRISILNLKIYSAFNDH